MKALMMLDWLSLRRALPLLGLYGLIFVAGLGWLEDGPAPSITIVVSSLAIALMAFMQSSKGEAKTGGLFAASLPARKADRLHAKLALLGWSGAFGFVSTSLLMLIASIPALGLRSGLPTWLDALRVLSGLLFLSALTPAGFLFGIEVFRTVLIVGLGLAMVAAQVLLVLRTGDGATGLRAIEAIARWFDSFGTVERNLYILGLGLLVAALSYGSARWILARKEY